MRERDFAGLETAYAYRGADRVVETGHADGTRAPNTYDGSGLLVREVVVEPDGTVRVTAFEREERGLITRAANEWATVEFAYDRLGRVVRETQTLADGTVHAIENRYDCCGNRIARSLNGRQTQYGVDPMGALTQVEFGGAHPSLFIERDALGREVRRHSPAGFELTQDYDAVGQLTHQALGRAGAEPFARRGNEWSRAFEPTRIAESHWGTLGYAYDANGQITETRFGDGAAERFGYDAAMNTTGSAPAPVVAGGETRSPGTSAMGGDRTPGGERTLRGERERADDFRLGPGDAGLGAAFTLWLGRAHRSLAWTDVPPPPQATGTEGGQGMGRLDRCGSHTGVVSRARQFPRAMPHPLPGPMARRRDGAPLQPVPVLRSHRGAACVERSHRVAGWCEGKQIRDCIVNLRINSMVQAPLVPDPTERGGERQNT